MPKPHSYVAGVIDQLDALETFISYKVPDAVAEAFLYSTLMDIPRPPWASGALRRSGAAYMGTKLLMTTEDLAYQYPEVIPQLGENPRARKAGSMALNTLPAAKTIKSSDLRYKGTVQGRSGYTDPWTGKENKIRWSVASKGNFGRSLSGKITIRYNAPHAAIMHEWTGGFSDPKSGAHFISSKSFMALDRAAFRIKANYALWG